ncbi:unnamed protein product [Sphenostylis stenocarpa]|uniref:Uncharacterized protein n=1 Tax=Sphenostylis stenocarpa TaxID=92480 RepID=A0AA86SS77_9FABA|nr:unnamed protein product [Sphenostylis stenocarpa]
MDSLNVQTYDAFRKFQEQKLLKEDRVHNTYISKEYNQQEFIEDIIAKNMNMPTNFGILSETE